MTARTVAVADTPATLARFHEELGFADTIARRARRQLGGHVALEELRSFAHEALLRAARTYDPARGIPFRSWASLRVRGAIIDGVRKHGVLPRRAFARLRPELREKTSVEAEDQLTQHLAALASMLHVKLAGGQGLERGIADSASLTPEEQLARAQTWAVLREAIDRLPEVERSLVELHYFGDATLDEAARALGLSKSWGSRLHARAIESISRDLRRQKVAA